MTDAITAEGLRKSFATRRGRTDAVRGVDLRVPPGRIFGFLGPNGAGKTTTVRMLASLLPIDGGTACVAGVDVRHHPHAVRRRIGYVGQVGGADLAATGRENLVLQARLHGAGTDAAAGRARQLIELFDLGEFVDRRALTYSGGQRRRLEVALGLVHRPALLFLDEPTIGLDPQNRAQLWDQLRALRESGTTVFLTTHYLEEADMLADAIAIIDRGRIVAEGTPVALKRQVAGGSVELVPRPGGKPVEEIRSFLAAEPYVRDARVDHDVLRLQLHDAEQTLRLLVAALAAYGIHPQTLTLREPSLDDVFLHLTGRALRDAAGETEDAA